MGRKKLAPILLAALALAACSFAAAASAGPASTRIAYATGTIVPIPASIPHEEGDMVDRRILPNLRWIAQRFPIYITDGYSGPLPNGEHAGCRRCHVQHSDHYNGLAVDIVPVRPSSGCDAAWRGITRLARWAEPVQNKPQPPFRWVGYDGDANHGCGHHLHLSWEHAVAPEYGIAEWVEVFPVKRQAVAPTPRTPRMRKREAPTAGAAPARGPQGAAAEATEAPVNAPQGGVSTAQSGGLAPGGD